MSRRCPLPTAYRLLIGGTTLGVAGGMTLLYRNRVRALRRLIRRALWPARLNFAV